MWRSLFHCDNAYYLPAVEVTGRVCRTHKTSQTAFRGFGGPQGMLVIEEILSRAAQRAESAGRRRPRAQLLSRGRRDALRRAGTRRGPHRADLERAEAIEQLRRAPRRRSRASTRAASTHKRGLAITPVKFGISFTATFYNQAGALVLVYRDGTVQVNHGGTEMGQGLFTKILQIAADSLGVPVSRVRVMPTRTDKVPNTSATAASSGTDLNGAAVAGRLPADSMRASQPSPPPCSTASRPTCSSTTASHRRAESRSNSPRCAKPPTSSACRSSPRGSTARRTSISISRRRAARRSTTSPMARRCPRWKSTASRGSSGCCEPTSCRTSAIRSRRSSIAARSKAAFCRASAGSRIEELLWDAQGRVSTGGASTYKLPVVVGDARGVQRRFARARRRSPAS